LEKRKRLLPLRPLKRKDEIITAGRCEKQEEGGYDIKNKRSSLKTYIW
jgi:hypothetical protein